jgi:hypothetical protein
VNNMWKSLPQIPNVTLRSLRSVAGPHSVSAYSGIRLHAVLKYRLRLLDYD